MNKKYLLNNKGMTLVEVMMAVAVFGIMLLFVTQMTNTSSRLSADNIEQLQMAEVAHAVAEEIKAIEKFDAIKKINDLEEEIDVLEKSVNELEKTKGGSGKAKDDLEKVKDSLEKAQADLENEKINLKNAKNDYEITINNLAGEYDYPLSASEDEIVHIYQVDIGPPSYRTGIIKINVGTIPMDINNPDNFQLVIWIPWLEGLE